MLPEEQELARLEAEQQGLRDEVAAAELNLETTKDSLRRFRHRYNETVGRIYAELDQLDAQIARIKLGKAPQDPKVQQAVHEAENKARESAEASGVVHPEPAPPPPPTYELKQAFRLAAKVMHPDLATDAQEKLRRHDFMARINSAYAQGDLPAIQKITAEFQRDPESIKGTSVAEKIVKTIRSIAQLKRRLAAIGEELAELQQGEFYALMQKVQEAEKMQRDILGELAATLLQQISDRKIWIESQVAVATAS